MKEREISLVDLMVEILLHWRGIILLMLVGGICFGGASYMKSFQTAETQKQAQTEQQTVGMEALSRKRLTETQFSNVNTVVLYEKLYEDNLDFFKNESVLMQLNPNKVPKAQLTFLVKTDDLEHTYNVEKVYENVVCSGGLYNYLASKFDMDTSAISEIVTLESEPPKRDVEANSFRLELVRNTDSFRLAVVHYDAELCEALAQSIIDYVNEQVRLLQRELGEHQVVVLDQSLATVADINIINRQKKYLNDIISNMSASAKLKNAFSDVEQWYYEYLVDGQSAEGTEPGKGNQPSASGAAPSVSIKYIMLGMVFAAFVWVFVIFLRYILDNKIKWTDDLQELYDLPQLGRIPRAKNRKPLGFIDEWFCTLRDRDKRKFTTEEATNLSAVAVKIAAKKNHLETVFLLGCDIKGRTQETCEQLKVVLEKEALKVGILNNVFYDAENMERLSDVQGVVLVETAGSTLYEEISKELDLMQRQNIVVLGGIVQE